MALASLFLLTSGHWSWGASHDTFCLEVFCFPVPGDLVSLGLGGALLLASSFCLRLLVRCRVLFVLEGAMSLLVAGAPALAGQFRVAAL
jgi:hypothetical protein